MTVITNEKEVSVFDSNSLKKRQKWKRENCIAVGRARWVDDQRILAGFNKPGDLCIYLIGNKNPILRFDPHDAASSWINDIEISKNGQFAYCGTWAPTLVFKIELKENPKTKWKHIEHTKILRTIRLCENERFLLSGGDDKKAELPSADNGVALATYKFTGWVTGILWIPWSQKALICSWNELVLLKWERATKLWRGLRR